MLKDKKKLLYVIADASIKGKNMVSDEINEVREVRCGGLVSNVPQHTAVVHWKIKATTV